VVAVATIVRALRRPDRTAVASARLTASAGRVSVTSARDVAGTLNVRVSRSCLMVAL